MKILIKDYLFEGPFYDFADIEDCEGIYVLLSGTSCRMEIEHLGHLVKLRQELKQLSTVDHRYDPVCTSYSISVLYSDNEDGPSDLNTICAELADWMSLDKEACGIVAV